MNVFNLIIRSNILRRTSSDQKFHQKRPFFTIVETCGWLCYLMHVHRYLWKFCPKSARCQTRPVFGKFYQTQYFLLKNHILASRGSIFNLFNTKCPKIWPEKHWCHFWLNQSHERSTNERIFHIRNSINTLSSNLLSKTNLGVR